MIDEFKWFCMLFTDAELAGTISDLQGYNSAILAIGMHHPRLLYLPTYLRVTKLDSGSLPLRALLNPMKMSLLFMLTNEDD